jgi:glycosyltransferase involved in cell wall biosynthesis
MPKVWIMSELYYPEDISTGYVMTKIAEGLSAHYAVHALCGQPTYSKRGTRAPRQELHNGVEINRCFGTTFNKDVLPLRAVNLLTISFSIWLAALWHLRRDDRVIVVTNPPSLPFVIFIACWLRRAKCLLLVHDVYPDVLTAAGVAKAKGIVTKCVGLCSRILYRNVSRIIVLGRDMKERILRYIAGSEVPISIIPNWSDLEEVVPLSRDQNQLLAKLQLQEKFVIQYCGNMGRTHGLETLLEAAKQLRHISEIHFLFIGSGAKKAWLEQTVGNEHLGNVTILPRQSRDDLNDALNACDLTVISFVKGMAGISVPSRMYNALSAGTPILAIADDDSELALIVHEEGVGWVVSPDASDQIVETILQARQDTDSLKHMGMRARRCAETKYSFPSIMSAYCELIEGLDSPNMKMPSSDSLQVRE